MRLSLFTRLILGYLIIFILFMTLSIYAILQLRQFNSVTRHILNIDNRILDFEKGLTDSMLSQLRYEKKFFITKDIGLYIQFLKAKGEFGDTLTKGLLIADTPAQRDVLARIKATHEQYQSLVDKEVEYTRSNQRFHKAGLEQEKDKIANSILKDLKLLEDRCRLDAHSRIKMLGEAGETARNITIVMTIIALVLVIAISFFMTRSITQPLTVLRRKTREVSEGVFNDDLTDSSLPEISDLTKAFNSMCKKLKEVDKIKSDFFSMMSHELRTPLTSIKEGTALLQQEMRGATTDRQRKLLTIIAEESHRLIGLVNSSLDLSKMEAGMMTYTFEQGSLLPLIDKVITELGPLVEAKKIRLEAKRDKGLPLIRMDRERILQVLRNLIGNAVKFTPSGGAVEITAGAVDGRVQVSVKDSGPGIPAENLSNIFNKFQQASPSGSHQIRGTGLGLAIVKHIITSHGGKIWVESELGQGSSFIFVL